MGLRSSDWPILEGIGPAIEAAIVDLSGRLAGCVPVGGRFADRPSGRPVKGFWPAPTTNGCTGC